MTDRELLKLAAQAAGHKLYPEWDCAPNGIFLRQGVDGDLQYVWDPLSDDGDALRLAVKLGFISPGRWPDAGLIALEQWGDNGGAVDWCAATRRAIVRAAAAEIGGANGS
jgi:hypothetical protein